MYARSSSSGQPSPSITSASSDTAIPFDVLDSKSSDGSASSSGRRRDSLRAKLDRHKLTKATARRDNTDTDRGDGGAPMTVQEQKQGGDPGAKRKVRIKRPKALLAEDVPKKSVPESVSAKLTFGPSVHSVSRPLPHASLAERHSKEHHSNLSIDAKSDKVLRKIDQVVEMEASSKDMPTNTSLTTEPAAVVTVPVTETPAKSTLEDVPDISAKFAEDLTKNNEDAWTEVGNLVWGLAVQGSAILKRGSAPPSYPILCKLPTNMYSLRCGMMKQMWDETHQTIYYFNSITHEAVWEPPMGYVPKHTLTTKSKEQARATQSNNAVRRNKGSGGEWTQVSDEATGYIFWYNTTTGESAWSKPPSVEATGETIIESEIEAAAYRDAEGKTVTFIDAQKSDTVDAYTANDVEERVVGGRVVTASTGVKIKEPAKDGKSPLNLPAKRWKFAINNVRHSRTFEANPLRADPAALPLLCITHRLALLLQHTLSPPSQQPLLDLTVRDLVHECVFVCAPTSIL